MKFASIITLAALAASAVNAAPLVHPAVHRTLRSQGSVNIFVTLKAGTDQAVNAVQESSYATRGEKIASLVTALEDNAKGTQSEVASLLAQESAGLFTKQQSFWLTNQIYIEGATFELVEKLAGLPSIAEISEEEVIQLEPITVQNTTSVGTLANEYGVTRIRAPEVWARGFTGEGVVVGHIDSGALAAHTSLRGNFRSTYSWFDPEALRATPYDNDGHGTHTIGTIAGAGGVGVAPGATWISCKGCRSVRCPQADLLACFQFMTCPTNTAGTVRDCSQAPQLVSNSWGGGQGATTYNSAIIAWRTAGIIPIFANGNSGPSCGTANSPADNANVIAVGATDSSDRLASSSSKGPSVRGLIKPEVSAPGVAVRSTWNTGTSAFNSISGTSMAAPHVAGAVALLLSARPSLTYTQIRTALTATTVRSLPASGYTCGSTADSRIPNNQYGYGRIDVLAALNSL